MGAHLLTEHFHLLAAAPNGVQKLRELILNLAVRGKLVPQDPGDEPASELLKKIAAEKLRLVAEGKIKSPSIPLFQRGKTAASVPPFEKGGLGGISEDEKPYALPQGWEWVRFGEIAQHNSGKTLDKGRNTGKLRAYITTSNLYWGRFELENVRQMPIRDEELEKCNATKNDLLICEGGEAGRAAVWNLDSDICIQNHIHRARFFQAINPYFAYRFFDKLNTTGEINQYRQGVGISNMSGKVLASIIFPLPPLVEQSRIVAKVDELMQLCDQLEAQQTSQGAAHERLVAALLGTLTQSADAQAFAENWARLAAHFDLLFDTPESIAKLKQTLLQLAVQGKLVPQDPSDEPAGELLKKIAAEKARLVAGGKIRKDKPLAGIGEDEKPFVVPRCWEWSRLRLLVFALGDGLHGTPAYVGGTNYYFINGNNLADGKIVIKPHTKTVSFDEMQKHKKPMSLNTVLVSINGTLGSMAFYNNEQVILGKSACYFDLSEYVNKHFVRLVIESQYFIDYALQSASGTTIKNLSLKSMNELPVPLPPFAEQSRIVAKVDEMMAVCDALSEKLTQARQLSQKLMQAITQSSSAEA